MVKKVAKVSHAGASGGTSKKVSDFSDVAISIENSQNFTGWAGNLYGILLDPSIPPNNPIDYQPADGRKSLLEIAEIELSQVFKTESNGSKWVEMG